MGTEDERAAARARAADALRQWARFIEDNEDVPVPGVELTWHLPKTTSPVDAAHMLAVLAAMPPEVDTLAIERLSPDTYMVKRHLSGVELTVFLPVATVEAVPGPAPLHPEFEAEGFRVEQRRRG